MDHGLVLAGDCSRMVKDEDLALELVTTLRLQQRVDHHHPLSYLRPFYLLQGETGSLAALYFRHRHPLTVYGPGHEGGEGLIHQHSKDGISLT